MHPDIARKTSARSGLSEYVDSHFSYLPTPRGTVNRSQSGQPWFIDSGLLEHYD